MDVEAATSATSTETIRRSPAVTDIGELYAARCFRVVPAPICFAGLRPAKPHRGKRVCLTRGPTGETRFPP